jgi:hypothetical protein
MAMSKPQHDPRLLDDDVLDQIVGGSMSGMYPKESTSVWSTVRRKVEKFIKDIFGPA